MGARLLRDRACVGGPGGVVYVAGRAGAKTFFFGALPMRDKRDDLIIREQEPFNAEPRAGDLVGSFETPVDALFVRNHAPVPEIDEDSYRLEIGGLVDTPLSLSLEELRSDFEAREITAFLMCAGNRRTQFFAIEDVPGEVPWADQAVGNARWKGVPLAAVLQAAGVQNTARHVDFLGLDRVEKPGEVFGFGGSIPVDKALAGEVLLAWELNGRPLPATHGWPLRSLVPGYIGARSVKWLGKIMLQEEPSENFYQRRAYRMFPPEVRARNADWDAAPMLGPMLLNSAILAPADGETVPAGPVLFRGWAVPPHGGEVAGVELTEDGGETWIPAELGEKAGDWSWRLWECVLELPRGRREVAMRARDGSGAVQPPDPGALWNFKGYMNNAWDRVTLECE